MADLRVLVAALAVLVTLLNTGVSYAADKVFIVCSGTATVYWNGTSTRPEGPGGLVVDLDGGIVTWGDAAIPIVKTEGTFVEFESKERAQALDSHSYSGTMDRVTGGVSMIEHWIRDTGNEEISYDLVCKRTNPVF